MPSSRIIVGDARTALAELPAGSVQCAVTSPPYYSLRDYGVAGQIGLEATVDAYVAELVAVFRAVRRCLRDDGVLWLNLGDSYAAGGSGGASSKSTLKNDGRPVYGARAHEQRLNEVAVARRPPPGLKPKDLLMVPARVAMALQADGWWLRSEVVWAKPNPMPESVRDRPTSAHEKLFLLATSERYFFDAAAIAEPLAESTIRIHSSPGVKNRAGDWKSGKVGNGHSGSGLGNGITRIGTGTTPATRNARNVQHWTPKPFKGSHYAVMPIDMAEWCVKAGTSEAGACPHCGAPWARVLEREPDTRAPYATVGLGSKYDWHHASGSARKVLSEDGTGGSLPVIRKTTVGWAPSCSCPAHEPVPQVVLDPFAGAGTTLIAASRLGRDAVGIELNAAYATLAEARIADAKAPGPKPSRPRKVLVSQREPSLFDGLLAAE